jgi:hypothetical protein
VAVSHPPLIVDDTWILLSGSIRWLSSLLPHYASTCRCLASVSYTPSMSDSLSKYASSLVKLDSSLAGSVLHQEWYFFLPSPPEELRPLDMYRCQMPYIIGPTVRPPSGSSSDSEVSGG